MQSLKYHVLNIAAVILFSFITVIAITQISDYVYMDPFTSDLLQRRKNKEIFTADCSFAAFAAFAVIVRDGCLWKDSKETGEE